MKRLNLGMMMAVFLAGGAQAACSDADKAALEKFDRDWSEAGRTGNRAALEAIYAADYVDLKPGDLTDGKFAIQDSIETAEKDRKAGKPASVTAHDMYLINCTANSAMITHRNTVTEGEGDHAQTFQTRSVHQLEKVGGKWKVVSNATHPLSDEMIVGYLDLEWNQAELKGDKAWFERTLADDYRGVSSRDGALETKESFLAAFGKDKVAVAETTDMDVQLDGDRGRVTGVYVTRGTDDKGKAFARKLRYIDVFVKRDGRWQIWSSQGTEIKG